MTFNEYKDSLTEYIKNRATLDQISIVVEYFMLYCDEYYCGDNEIIEVINKEIGYNGMPFDYPDVKKT